MTEWKELVARDKTANLPTATRHETADGEARYVFRFEDQEIADPSHDATGALFVSPRDYGFSIRGFQGGKTAWAKDFTNGVMLISGPDGQSHVLSPRYPARVLFVGNDGAVLQDTGAQRQVVRAASEVVTVRLTVSVDVDLNGESQEAVRARLASLLDAALSSRALATDARLDIVDHVIDQVSVSPSRQRRSSDTDFSQLLDL
jgi:hypothetical protein